MAFKMKVMELKRTGKLNRHHSCLSIYLINFLEQFWDPTKSGGRLVVIPMLQDHVDHLRIPCADSFMQDWKRDKQREAKREGKGFTSCWILGN